MKRALIAVCMLVISGCATNLQVTYLSDPPGATLYENGRAVGTAPRTLVYSVSKEDKARGYMSLTGITARWVSGASASISSLTANLSQGLRQSYSFQRPDVPGSDVDANYALQLQRNAILEEQAAAQRSQAAAAAYANMLRQQQIQQQRQQQTLMPRNCNSYVYGNQIQTTCN